MKIRLLFIIHFFSLFTILSFGQEGRLKYLGVETGMVFIKGEMSDMKYIRGDVPYYLDDLYYNDYYYRKTTKTWMYKSFLGIKYEIFSMNDRFGLSGGLRFSRIISSIGKNDYWTHSTDYFYFLLREDGLNTDYLTIKEIKQKSNYMGIPLELRFFPMKRPHFVSFYIKMGTEFNFLLNTKKEVMFDDNSMKSYEKDVTSKLAEPDLFNASVYLGEGIRIGGDLKPSVSIEACFPYFFLTNNSCGFINPIFGGGFQINVQIPLK